MVIFSWWPEEPTTGRRKYRQKLVASSMLRKCSPVSEYYSLAQGCRSLCSLSSIVHVHRYICHALTVLHLNDDTHDLIYDTRIDPFLTYGDRVEYVSAYPTFFSVTSHFHTERMINHTQNITSN